MKKMFRNCFGIFIFLLTFILYKDVVLATHESCGGSRPCGTSSVTVYICPNSGDTTSKSATACNKAVQSGKDNKYTLVSDGDTVPLYYDEANNKETLLLVKGNISTGTITNVAALSASFQYDPNKFELIYANYYENSFPNYYDEDEEETYYYWNHQIGYGEGLGKISGKGTESTIPVGKILCFSNTGSAGNYLLPWGSQTGPYVYDFVFRVKVEDQDTIQGETALEPYEAEVAYGEWNELARNGESQGYYYYTDGTTFTLGNALPQAAAPITNIQIFESNASGAKEFKFGDPSGTYPVNFSDGTNAYDLYLPANLPSIYITASYSDGASVSGDIGTKLLSTGTGTFTVSGTGTDSNVVTYTITYHVPNTNLSALTSPGKWVSPNTFEPSIEDYDVYLQPSQAASVSVSATLQDNTGGLQSKFIPASGTESTLKAKNQVSTISDTLTNVKTGDKYQVITYGADCFGAYKTALYSGTEDCTPKTYTITYKVIDRTFSSISIVGTADNYTYGIPAASYNPNTFTYTVVVPNSETSVKYSAVPTDSDVTKEVTDHTKSLEVGDNTITINGVAKNDSTDTYKETYTITVHRLSEDATLSEFSSSAGTLGTPTETTSGNTTTKVYALNVGSTITTTNFTITPTDSTKAYLDTTVTDHGGTKPWTIDESTPYHVVVKSESCNPDYASLHNNVCKQTDITVNATKLSADTSIQELKVRDSEGGSTYYTVSPVTGKDDEFTVVVPSTATGVYVTVEPKTGLAGKQEYVNTGAVSLTGSAGSNKLHTVTVKAEDRTITKDYKLTIHKAGTDATLKSFTTSDGTNPIGKWNKAFQSSDNAYSAIIEDTVSSVVVNAEANDRSAKLNGTTASHTYNIVNDTWNLSSSPITYTITVNAESCMVTGDTCVTKTYTLEMTKKSAISELTSITVKSAVGDTTYGTKTIATGTTSYKVAVPAGTTAAKIEVEKADGSKATISGDGDVTGLTTGSNVQTITSVSEYGEEHKSTYSLDIYVLTEDTTVTLTSSKPTLSLDTVDNADGTKYTLKINDTEPNTSITATAHTTSFINTEATGNTKTETWTFTSASPDTYTVKVFPEKCKTEYASTACTDSDAKIYVITKKLISTSTKPSKIKVVNPSDPDEVYDEIDFTTSPAPTAPYKLNVPADVENVKLVVDKGAEEQQVTGDGEYNVNVGDNNKTVSITSEAGGTPQSYNINIYRPSSTKELTGLTFSKGTLDPAFAAGTTSYELKISEVETGVTASATSSTNSYINTEATGNSLTNDSWTFAGNNTYTVKVFPEKCKAEYASTACTDSDATVYTVTLKQLNNEKNLTSLKVNEIDATPDGTDKYKVYLKPSETGATFTCTASDGATCAGDALTSLTDGPNNGTVRVTAEDGTHKDIEVNVYKVSNKTEISALSFTEGALKETIADGTYTYTGKFSDSKTTTNLTYTAKYNGFIDEGNTNENASKTDSWSLEDPISPYKFTVKSESCKSTYSADIQAECATKEFTVNYEAINSATTLATISVKDQNNVEYFTGSATASSNTVYVPSGVTQYTVAATAENSSATVGISPTQPVTTVVDGDNPTVTITVTPPADSGASAATYTVIVHRLSDSAELTSLSSSVGNIKPTLVSGTYNYDLELTDDTNNSTNISATANNDNAKLTINSDTANKVTKEFTGRAWNLTSANTFTIRVESEACEHVGTVTGATCTYHDYVITKKVLSNDTVLAGLTVKSADEATTYTLDPVFSTSETQYTVNLPNGTTTAAIIIDPGTNGPSISNQTITSGGTVAKDGTNPNKINASGLVTGDNKVTITLTAQNGVGSGSYEVTLHVKNNAKTLNLTSSVGTLTPQTGGWKLTIPNGSSATETKFTATIPSGATIKMNGTVKTSPYEDDWTFSDGGTYEIEVTPEEGEPQTYTVVCEVQGPELSDDNSLTGLTADNGTVTKEDDTHYKLEVPYGTTSSVLTATIPSGATIKMGGTDVTSSPYSATWSGYTDGGTYEIEVKSEKGTPKTYTVTVDIGEPTTESSSTLHSITVKKTGADETYTVYSPTFAADSKTPSSYTVYVPYTTTNVDVSAVATDTSVTPVLSESSNILLAEGGNDVTIAVTSATDSSDTTTYTLTIHRLCNNTDLGSLSVSAGTLNETFSASTTEYTIFINNSYPSATVTATLPEAHTHGYINAEDNTSTTFTWDFNSGENTEYTLTVYSESCKAAYASVEGNANQCNPKTYKITATFFADKITSDTFGLKLETFEGLDIIADARVDSIASDLKGEQTDNPSENLVLYRADGLSVVPDGEIVATGMILRLIINGTTYDERTLVVPGDTNGDGVIDIFDLLPIVDHILDTVPLTGPYLRAADYNNADGVDIFDLLPIVDYILGQ